MFEFRKSYKYIKYAKRDLDNSKKYLLKKEKYLQEHPNTNWAKKDVEKYKLQVIQNTKKLKQENLKFDKIYNQEITKLDSQIKQLSTLEDNINNASSQHQHNIKVFVKTYQELINKGYENHIIGKYLSKDRQMYKADKYNISDKIKLDHSDGMAFSGYMKTIQSLLK